MLKYWVNKLVSVGREDCWLFWFKEFYFLKVVVKPGKHNVGPDHLYRLESRETGGSVYYYLPDMHLFWVEDVLD